MGLPGVAYLTGGAAAGMISGAVMVFTWKFGISKLGGAFAIYELLPAFITALVFIIGVSLLTPAPEKDITEEFTAVQSEIRN